MVKYPILAAFGLELEYAIVDKISLEIVPKADILLEVHGNKVSELNRGELAWSNELVKHVIEIKNPQPVQDLQLIGFKYLEEVETINRKLDSIGCMLLPTGAHPWMNSETERVLWEQEQTEIYYAYDRIFSTKGHGWANLQSAHLNISFSNSKEFGQLQRILRFVLPLIPGLSASTPYFDNRFSGSMDGRMVAYAKNQKRIPSIAGEIIPEPIYSISTYQKEILAAMYRDIQPFDSDGLLQDEWLNSRGAIPKFSRNSMEIRIIDLQAHPWFDLLIANLILTLMKHLHNQILVNSKLMSVLENLDQTTLVSIYQSAIQQGSIADARLYHSLHSDFSELFPFTPTAWEGKTMREFWALMFYFWTKQTKSSTDIAQKTQEFFFQYQSGGTWAEQTFAKLGTTPIKDDLRSWYKSWAVALPGVVH
jgi:carboxylate-amine ligase